ncbi:MAG TPA: pirin family protein [Nocardioidaceae bacterium]|nr:pirin family protein [Nocardioidaceae bacterium]
MPATKTEVRRAADRFTTTAPAIKSRHSFSFGAHYDPDNTGHGLLLAHNDEVVQPGAGFETHAHRDTEIVTWVVHGRLMHQDSTGHTGVVHPGLAQRMSAGTGIEHSERNASSDEPVRFVQMWVSPDEPGLDPGYEQREIGDELAGGGLVTVASGMPQHRDYAAIRINSTRAALHAARLAPAGSVTLPAAPYLHLFVARGTVDLEGVGRLDEGDAVRFTGGDGQRVTATGDGAEVLAWEMHADLRTG